MSELTLNAQPGLAKFDVHKLMMKLGKTIEKTPGGLNAGTPELQKQCPVKESFTDGLYVREIFMPKDMLVVTQIHKHQSPYFILQGDCSVLSEDGTVDRISAPHSGITVPGTQRVIYVHEDTVWVTVHTNPDNDRDTKTLVNRLTMKPSELKKISEDV